MSSRTRTARSVAAGLRTWAGGHGPHIQAAVGLLIGHGVWLARVEFHAVCVHRDPDGSYWIDWTAARTAFDAGLFAGASVSERAVLDVTLALAADRYRLGAMSTGKARLVCEAVAAAAGIPLPRRPHHLGTEIDEQVSPTAVEEPGDDPMTSTVLILAALLAATAVSWRRGARGVAVGCGLCACLPAITLAKQVPWPAYLAAAAVAGFVLWNRLARSAGVVARWSARSRRRAGVASATDIARHASARAVRRRATTVRPSLAGLSRWGRRRLPAVEVGLRLCRTAWQTVWASIEDVVLVFGGPRVGKTGLLAGLLLDAPGAALVTSTRTDLYELCAPLRQERGPVYVFNAVGLAGLPSTITFDPLTGCADPVTAIERAADLLGAVSRGDGSGDREFWDGQARRILAALLHAAALADGRRSMAHVQAWVADPEQAARDVPALLRCSGVAAFEQDALQFIGTNERTRTSITSTVMPALGWLNHPAAAAAAAPGHGFDVAALLESRATVFLLGAEETQAAPLVCALTGHIAREARRLAALRPGGRLDPPLALVLDEAALISPVPLESWTADMGGRGVTILAAFQSRAQLLARWGAHHAATILNNTGALLVFGGTRDRDDLQFWSTLAGDRDEPITTTDLHGRVASRTVRRVPVLPPAQIANLPAGRVLVIRRGIPPVIGKAQMAWRRRDVRAHDFARRHPDLIARRTRWATRLRARRLAFGAALVALPGRGWRGLVRLASPITALGRRRRPAASETAQPRLHLVPGQRVDGEPLSRRTIGSRAGRWTR